PAGWSPWPTANLRHDRGNAAGRRAGTARFGNARNGTARDESAALRASSPTVQRHSPYDASARHTPGNPASRRERQPLRSNLAAALGQSPAPLAAPAARRRLTPQASPEELRRADEAARSNAPPDQATIA